MRKIVGMLIQARKLRFKTIRNNPLASKLKEKQAKSIVHKELKRTNENKNNTFIV